MLLYNILKHIPYLGLKLFDHLLCALDIVRRTVGYKLLHNKGLEKLYRHLLWKTALIYLKLGTYDDNASSGIIHALSEKVLTEASALTL